MDVKLCTINTHDKQYTARADSLFAVCSPRSSQYLGNCQISPEKAKRLTSNMYTLIVYRTPATVNLVVVAMCATDTAVAYRSLVKGGRGQSGQAIKLFQTP